jgi:hypothetical protein
LNKSEIARFFWTDSGKKNGMFFSEIFIFVHGIGIFRFLITPSPKNIKKKFQLFKVFPTVSGEFFF